MTARQAVQGDREALGRIYCYSWKAAYRGVVPDSFLDGINEESAAPKRVSEDKDLVICDGNKVVGVCHVTPSRDKELAHWGEIVAIYLLPECFGKGFGRILLKSGVDKLHSWGYSKIYLWVLAGNERARKFYEKNGFVNSGEEKKIEIGGKALTEVKYINTARDSAF